MPADRNAAIIDVGCGNGDFVRFAHGLGYRDILALDIDRNALSLISELDGVVKMHAQADARFFNNIDKKFDLIILKQMIYYYDRGSVVSFLEAARDKLSEEGTLIVEIFNGGLLSGRYTEVKDPGIRTSYSELSLERLLVQCGYVVHEIFGFRQSELSFKTTLYQLIKNVAFSIWRALLILERGRDDELPRISAKTIIAIAKRSK